MDKSDKSGYPTWVQAFPYVNGKLFRDSIHIPELTAKTRELMIECGDRNNWKEINPDIFGSMFQAVKTAEVRSGLGQHYTSVPNIMKVINPLFMDELREEFEKAKDNVGKLRALQLRLSKIRVFDPACGSGNFLIIAFKQMKLLEMDIIKRIRQLSADGEFKMKLSVVELKQFYGIEIDDFACEIARLSLWLADHQMNCRFKDEFGETRPTLPLCESGHIVCGNALRMNWEEVCPKYIYKRTLSSVVNEADMRNMPLRLQPGHEPAEVYLASNPPYAGTSKQSVDQKSDMSFVLSNIPKYKELDYICCWFYLGANYIHNHKAKLAFVTTNSLTQGQQVSDFWPHILINDITIHFAYESFKWTNNAKNNAGVTCSIIGLKNADTKESTLFDDSGRKNVKNINPYLIDYKNIYVYRKTKSISNFPPMDYGNYTGCCNNLILTKEEYIKTIKDYPETKRFLRPISGSQEFIKNIERWCFWIQDKELQNALKSKEICRRIRLVEEERHNAKDNGIKKLASRSHQFRDMREAKSNSLIIPRVSSEHRKYIPIGFLNADYIILDSAQAIYDAEPWIFGVVTSLMHMVWVRAVAGRLKTDYRYSAELCYNTFPFPKISDQQKKRIEFCVFEILRVRERYSERTMAELYDPDTMPKDLLEAHHSLDMVIESCYRRKPFENDEQRLAHLFKMYEMMTNNASEEELKQLELGV